MRGSIKICLLASLLPGFLTPVSAKQVTGWLGNDTPFLSESQSSPRSGAASQLPLVSYQQSAAPTEGVVALARPTTRDVGVDFEEVNDEAVYYPRRGWLGGVEATYLKATSDQANFPVFGGNNFQFEAAPRVWVEHLWESGWGIRAAYWTYNAQAQSYSTMIPMVFVNTTNVDRLELYSIDLELTRRVYFERSDLWVSLGVRNGRLHRGTLQTWSNMSDVPGFSGAMNVISSTNRDFYGTGLTSGLGWRRPIADTNFALVTNFRNSVLWGGNNLDLHNIQTVSTVINNNLEITYAADLHGRASDGGAMWIGELQVGGEWSRDVSTWLPGVRAFSRVMFEGQWWGTPELESSDLEAEMFNLVGVTGAIGFMR